MKTLMTTTNAGDWILLVDGEKVVGAWMADDETVRNYLDNGADAAGWNETYPEQTAISDYGEVVGRNGKIDDEGRSDFWDEVLED